MITSSKVLRNKLEEWFYKVNIKKYRHLFGEWFDNLTDIQLEWWSNHF